MLFYRLPIILRCAVRDPSLISCHDRVQVFITTTVILFQKPQINTHPFQLVVCEHSWIPSGTNRSLFELENNNIMTDEKLWNLLQSLIKLINSESSILWTLFDKSSAMTRQASKSYVMIKETAQFACFSFFTKQVRLIRFLQKTKINQARVWFNN